jgi:hypothetical protein
MARAIPGLLYLSTGEWSEFIITQETVKRPEQARVALLDDNLALPCRLRQDSIQLDRK